MNPGAVAAVVLLAIVATLPPPLSAQDTLRTRVAWSSHCGDIVTSGHMTFDPSGTIAATVIRAGPGTASERTKWRGHAVTIKAPQTVCSPGAPVYQLLLHGSFVGTQQQAASAPASQTLIQDAGAIPLTFESADDAARAYREIRCLLLPARCVH